MFIQKGLHNDSFSELWKLVRLKRINYKHVPLEKINRLTRKNHQGVFTCLYHLLIFIILKMLFQIYTKQGKNTYISVDKITDVRNFGLFMGRTECTGVNVF